MSEDGIEILRAPGVMLHLSARHFPVLIVTWFGMPSVGVAERYVDWIDRMAARAKEEGTKVVILGDTTDSGQPSPEVRRAMARALERLAERNGDGFIGGTTIINNPFVRAAITIVLTLVRAKIDFKPVRSVEAAFERIQDLLHREGIPWPEGLDPQTYERPPPPD